VVAGTGHGTVSARMEAAIARARGEGVRVTRASRCVFGPVLPHGADDVDAAGDLSAVQARVELQLALLADAG
jgi:L-asparaginase